MTLRSLRGWAVAAMVLAAIVGCRDASGPSSKAPRDVDVTLRIVSVEGPTVSLRDGLTDVECSVLYEAAASAEGGPGFWEGGQLLFFAGRDRSEAIDTLRLSLTEVAEFWGGAQILAGDTLRTQLTIGAGVPFATKLMMQYRPRREADVETLEASFACGATVPAGAPPPSLTPLAVAPASGTVDYGQVMTIGFTAQSQIGFVQTELRLSGACELERSENHFLEKTVVRSIEILLPAGCRNGEPLVITVTALDGALELASRQFTTTLSFVDRTPPTILPIFFPRTASPFAGPSGDYFVGDSIVLIPNAHDNRGVAAFVWEVLPSGVRDSVVTMPSWSDMLRIPVRDSWGTGPIQLRFFARDAAGMTSEVYTSQPGALAVYPTIDAPVRTGVVQGIIRELVIDRPRGLVYLLQWADRRIAVLSLETMTVTRTIALPTTPSHMDITPRGDSLIVTLPESRALGVIDLRTPSAGVALVPLTILDAATQQVPGDIRVLTSGKAFVTLLGNGQQAHRLAEVDLSTNAQRIRLDAGDAGYTGIGLLERSHDHTALVIQGGPELFQRYDVGTDRFGPRRSGEPHNARPSLDAAGRRVALRLDVYDESLQLLRRVSAPVATSSFSTALSPSGEYLYSVMGTYGIVRSRVSDGAIVGRIRNPIDPGLIGFSADGTLMVVVEDNRGTGRIAAFDLR